ncbi:MAG: helix-turn-helix domain-containing protein [Clostridiales bacterium]|nr:helix-turn-helix domain-containing protein [Clostridiales bacterium]
MALQPTRNRYAKVTLIQTLRNFKFNSIFLRMLLTTLCVFLALCAVNFVGIRVMAQKALDNERNNSEFYVDYSYSYMNRLIQKLEQYMHALEYDSNIIFLRSLLGGVGYARNHAEVTDIFNRLSVLTGLIDEIERVYIYFPNIDRIMTSMGEYELPTFFMRNYGGDFAQWRSLLTRKYPFTFNIWDLDTAHGTLSQLNLVQSLHDGAGAKSVIVANLKRDLVKIIFKDNTYASTRRIYIADDGLRVFSSNTDEAAGTALAIDRDRMAAAEKGSFYTDDYLVSYRHLPQNDLYFVVMTPRAIMLENVNNLTLASYVFLAIMLAMGLVFSMAVSQQFYLPIGQLLKDMERFATVSRGLPGQQNEYEYLHNNIDAIAANNQKLESILRDSVPFIIDIIVMKLAGGGAQEAENAMLLARQFNIAFKSGNYSVALMKCSHSYYSMSQKALTGLTLLIKRHLADSVISVLKLREDEIVIVAFCGQCTDPDDEEMARLRQLSALLEDAYEDESFYIGLGCRVGGIFELHESLRSARAAFNCRRAQDSAAVFRASADAAADADAARPGQDERKVPIPADFEQRYRNALCAGNMDRTENMLYGLMESCYSRNITLLSYYSLCAWLHGIMERAIDTSYEDMAKKVSKDLLEDVSLAGDILELNERVLRDNRLLCSAFMADRKTDAIQKKLLGYIEQNFSKSISLDGAAASFGYNSSYFSRLFKHAAGASFSDCLSRKRIDHAKGLLGNRKKTIKAIAEESGYNSTSIFIKAFVKSETGRQDTVRLSSRVFHRQVHRQVHRQARDAAEQL